jgi:hypothetical protein
MPGLDHSGPEGKGAMTGRKTGLCVGNSKNDLMGSYRGRRGGMRFGGGTGRRYAGRGPGFGRYGRNISPEYDQPELDTESLQEEIRRARLHLSELEEKLQKLGKK